MPPSRARGLLARLALASLLAAAAAPATIACKAKEETRAPLSEGDAEARAEALAAYLKQHPGDVPARLELAHVRWLHLGEPTAALPVFEDLSKKDEPLARFSRMLMADARIELDVVRAEAMALVKMVSEGRGIPAVDPRVEAKVNRKRKRFGLPPRALLTREELVGFAEIAARMLENTQGDVPGDDAAFVRFYDALHLDGLPVEVRQPLTSERAKIARRLGQDYRRHYDLEGCVQAWRVGPLVGTLGALELRRAEEQIDPRGAVEDDPSARLTPLACVVRIWNPTPRTGVRRMLAELDVPGERLDLELATQRQARVYLDGALIHRNDQADRWPADRVRLTAKVTPGRHVLEVRAAIPEDRVWALVRATDERGRGIPAKPAARPPDVAAAPQVTRRLPTFTDPVSKDSVGLLAAPVYRPLRDYLAGMNALADGDTDRAEVAAKALRAHEGRFAEGHILIAAFEIADPSREATASKARQRKALERAIELDPSLDRARIRLLEMGLERGEHLEVLEQLAAMPKALHNVDGELLRFRAQVAGGNEYAAEQALARAAELHADSCQVLSTQRAVARGRNDVGREDAVVARMAECPGTLGLRAQLAFQRGDYEAARALLGEQLDRTPDDLDALTMLGDVAVAEGRLEEALTLRRRVLEFQPFSASARLSVPDLEARLGRVPAARQSIAETLELLPYSSAVHEIAENFGFPDDLLTLRVDGLALLADYRALAEDPYEGASEVLVLDRSAARIYPNGSIRQLVHTITELRTKEAIDKYGEITPPEGARLLTLHSIKPDGTIVVPEHIDGKDGLSLRGLAPGDAVEYEFIIDQEPTPMLPGYLDVGRFSFQSRETPFHVSELLIASPKDMPLQIERRGDAPQAIESTRGALLVRQFRVTESLRLGVEPAMRSLVDEVPSVRVFTPLDTDAWLEALTLQLYAVQRANPELRALVRKLVGKIPKAKRRARLEALHAWVLENIEETGDMSTPATTTLSAKQGSRLMLLKAMLREAGVRAEVWVGRDRFGPQVIKGGHPMVETYAAPVLAVWPDPKGSPVMVLTNSEVMPLGYLPPALAGSKALRIRLGDDEGAPGEVTLPQTPAALADRRDHTLEIEIDRDGVGTVRGVIELQGMEAVLWRGELKKVDRDRLAEGFERAELAHLFRGATLDIVDIEILDEEALQKPLRLQFTASIRGATVRQGGAVALPASAVPLNMGMGFTTLPRRATGLVIPYAPSMTARVTFRLDGATFSDVPDAVTLDRPHGTYTRRIVEGGEGQASVTIETHATLELGIVEPGEYPTLATFTREVKMIEDELLRAR
ncbi:MAG: tetratricopeptide repeat protein [Myxococcales bacterium]|nr:tetratricopeptide repeat protein [Myxococcales bacterium]